MKERKETQTRFALNITLFYYLFKGTPYTKGNDSFTCAVFNAYCFKLAPLNHSSVYGPPERKGKRERERERVSVNVAYETPPLHLRAVTRHITSGNREMPRG